jgi:hypothetical protein
LTLLDNLFYLFVGQTQQDVLGFEIGVYDSANSVKKIKAHKYLSCDFLNNIKRQSFVVVSFEYF